MKGHAAASSGNSIEGFGQAVFVRRRAEGWVLPESKQLSSLAWGCGGIVHWSGVTLLGLWKIRHLLEISLSVLTFRSSERVTLRARVWDTPFHSLGSTSCWNPFTSAVLAVKAIQICELIWSGGDFCRWRERTLPRVHSAVLSRPAPSDKHLQGQGSLCCLTYAVGRQYLWVLCLWVHLPDETYL